MKTAILVAGDDALLALMPETDVERRLVKVVTGPDMDVTVCREKWVGTIGGAYRSFQGFNGDLVLVARKVDMTAVDQATAAEFDPSKVTRVGGDPVPAPRTDTHTTAYPTKDDLVELLKDYVDGATSLAAQAVLQRFPSLPSPNAVLNVVAGTNTISEKVTRIFALFAGEADPALEPRTTTPDSRDRQDEGPAPLHELDRDSVGMLQLRRDVKWLEDRGVRDQVSLLPHTFAEMVGLDVTEFLTLTLKTRQKFENRAYTALRALNSGAKK